MGAADEQYPESGYGGGEQRSDLRIRYRRRGAIPAVFFFFRLTTSTKCFIISMSMSEGSGKMTTSEQIRVLCVRTGVSLSELARRINQSPQNFNAKLKRNTITQDELNRIADALGVTYEQYFVLANGEQVK
ncbi:MAG: helix-turn-helix transcriptional regulator [Evtepia sp.]|nr:helix-turn-helix transcriptional regulator [Evtepia sp.]MDY3015485.1 helix-turn-helix transcriptional regulator [Evtepia sp.]